ncbi:hypothetical protein [Longivirga aurantiaca]|uniref:DUF2157 domain-containing protein n=1 Tax=Longivirga aurantiaca TaxID=1837743 RepID=A0ABW1T2J7_9ACTN
MSDGETTRLDPEPLAPRQIRTDDHEHIVFVREVFLPLARARGRVGREVLDELGEYAWYLESAVGRADAVSPARAAAAQVRVGATTVRSGTSYTVAPAVAPPGTMPAPRTTAPPTRTAAPVAREVPAPAPAQEERGPSRSSLRWARFTDSVGSDLATHGLAYLGVLLLFIGVFGLVAFAFGDVAPTMRPVAEIGIALAPFVAAWMLLRRGADIAGRALETAGGLLLPVMLVTSFLDGVPVPPDLVGVPLAITLTLVTAAVSGAYALWSLRHRTSALRYLVAPVAWLSVGLAVMGVGREIPSGSGVAVVTAAQVAAISVAMAASLLWARLAPAAVLSAPTLTSGAVGSCVVALLALMTWISGGWPPVAIAVTGVAGLAVLELLDGRVPHAVVRIAQPLWWALAATALLPALGPTATGLATAAALGCAGFLVLVELSGRDRASLPFLLAGLGLGGTFLVTLNEPWFACAAAAVLAVWSGVRRLHGFAVPWSRPALDVVAGLMPVVAVTALGFATRHAPLALMVGSVLVLLAVVPIDVTAVRVRLRRDPADHFWMLWWDAGMVAAVVATVVMVTGFWPADPSAQWILGAVPAVLALSAAVGPLRATWRPWPTLALLTWSWLITATTAGWPLAWTLGAPAVVALVIVALVHALPRAVAHWSSPGQLGTAALVLLVVCIALAGTPNGWLPALLVSALAAGLVLVTAYDEVGRSPVADVFVDLMGPDVRYAGAAFAALSVPLSAMLLLDASGALPFESWWAGITLSVTALVYAAATRLPTSAHLGRVLTWTAIAGSLAGVAVAWSTTFLASSALLGYRWAMVAALAAVAVLPLLLAPARRPLVGVWLGWAAVVPTVSLAAALVIPAYADLGDALAAATALVLLGGALLLGALALDLRGRAWEPVLRPVTSWLRPPAALGALEVVAGAAIALAVTPQPDTWGGWLLVLAALVVAGVAALARAWSLVAGSTLLAWIGTLVLAGEAIASRPWIPLLVAALVLAAAEVAHRLVPDRRAWVRADVWLLAAAHVPAITALVVVTEAGLALVLLALGVLAAVVAWRLRTLVLVASAYGMVAGALVLLAGATAGQGWQALAFAAVSVACSAVAARIQHLPSRLVLVATGSVLGLVAWLSLVTWVGWSDEAVADSTVLLAAAVTAGAACLVRWTSVDRLVLLVRGAVAVLTVTVLPMVVGAGVGAGGGVARWLTPAVAASVLVVAVSCAVVARPLGQAWLRHAAAAYSVLALVESFVAFGVEPGGQLAVLAVLALAASVTMLVPWRTPLGEWALPLAAFGAMTTFAGLVVALIELPDPGLVPAALLVSAAYSASLGVSQRLVGVELLAPVLACAAWITWAAQALDGNPQWFTVPIGLALLVSVALLRLDRRTRGVAVDSTDVVVLEVVGIAFLVGASFVQIFTVSLAYAGLAAAIGLAIVAWAVLTRVRRRLTLGVAITCAALALLVLVPLAQLLPAWTGATLWIAIAAIGLVAILVATLLEQGRAVVRRGIDQLHRLTEGWE